MKKIIRLFVIILVLQTLVNAQTWRSAFNTPVIDIAGGCMVDQNTAWIAGGTELSSSLWRSGIYQSTDGGMTWDSKYMSERHIKISDICFVNSTIGFAALDSGKILTTNDGGDTWQQISTPDTTYNNTKIHFFDANLGFTLSISNNGSGAKIYKTTDGGNSWTLTDSIAATINTMDFYSPTVGIAAGNAGNLYYTTDGATWNKAPAPTFPISYSRTDQFGLKFISATTAVSCGWATMSAGFQPTIFLKTTNGGASWAYMPQASSNLTYVNFNSIYFKDQLNGIAAGQNSYPGTVICRTTDGGVNWIPLPTVSGFVPKIVMGFNDKVIISGSGGNIILSSDFGNSWITNINNHPLVALSSINIINNNIYSCGYSGVFYKSTDLGENFNTTFMTAANKCLWSQSCYFLNENLGYASGQDRQILKTTNAGASWTQVLSDSNSNFVNNYGMYFINENIGFVVGRINSNVDITYKTTDGGQSWSNVQNIAFQNLYCVSFADSIHGAAGGNNSAIIYTTDQGVSWKTATVNATAQSTIYGITFYNGLSGIAVGSGIILKTTDGGATWNQVTVDSYLSAGLKGICYNASGIYTVGNKFCLKSTDYGNTWVNIMDTVFAVQNGFNYLNDVKVDKYGFIWAASNNAGIITNSSLNGIKKDAIQPGSFSLEQNYPNPFNPSTMISFTNPQRGFVTLKLFDILGREVRIIYKGEMAAGTHTISFNAGNLASGNYIYSLQVDDQFICRKMTLLK